MGTPSICTITKTQRSTTIAMHTLPSRLFSKQNMPAIVRPFQFHNNPTRIVRGFFALSPNDEHGAVGVLHHSCRNASKEKAGDGA